MSTPTPAAGGPPAVSDRRLMVKKFLKHGTTIASFSPSSKALARAMVEGIDYDRAECIVELGAGTGPITAQLLPRVKPHTRVVVVELDPDFCGRLREKFPAADICQGDATKLSDILAERGITQVDHVVSGLPLPSFSEGLRSAVLAASAKVLAPHGTFRQLTVMPWVYWGLYRRYFADVTFKLVMLNLPPAGVYVCRGYKEQAAGASPPSPPEGEGRRDAVEPG